MERFQAGSGLSILRNSHAMDPGKDTPGETIREHELAEALRSAGPETRDWRFEKREVKCQSCQAITVFEASRAAQRCEFCGSPSIVPVEAGRDAITPTAVLPAKLSEPQVRDRLRQWYASRMFAPDRFKKAALTDTLHGLYLPYWTFDAHVHAAWTAMAGYIYFENVQRRGADGRIVTVSEQRVRWEPAAGRIGVFLRRRSCSRNGGGSDGASAQGGTFPHPWRRAETL